MVGLPEPAFATVRTQRDIHTGTAQDALGDGLLEGRRPFDGAQGRRGFGVDRLADGGKNGFAVAGGHPAEVTDFVETIRQNVSEKATGEDLDGDRFGLLDVILGTVAPGVSDATVLDGLDAVVADGDLVRVAGDLVEGLGGIRGCRFGKDDPGLVGECGE